KKYDTSFATQSYIGYIAYKNDAPAAFYGVFPCIVEYDGKKIIAAQSGDTMTHPSHQGKGLFIKLAKMTYELAKEKGIEFIFGFPNKNSYPGFVKKLNWVHTENINTYTFKIKTIPLIELAKKLKLTSLYISYALIFIRRYVSQKTHFNNSIINNENGGLVHDESFFNYKSYTKKFILEIEDILIWLKLDGRLYIGDIETTSLEKFEKALKKLKIICFFIGCNKIQFNISPNTYWDKILKKKYKHQNTLPIGYYNLNSELPLEKIKFTGADFDTF
ncbi:MAG TPA: GNAT family N-acetyltransferase, partial [Bacteroidia bacterium]|nr:GNAT family N-acetyltransferase [Bacteroidia bacterium]